MKVRSATVAVITRPSMSEPLLPVMVLVYQFQMQKKYPKCLRVSLNSYRHFSPHKSVLISVKCNVVGLYLVKKCISFPEFHRCRSPFSITFRALCNVYFGVLVCCIFWYPF